ncbi:MAG: hypothetical protein ACE5E5_06445 [Phycisphaerae bacterium]
MKKKMLKKKMYCVALSVIACGALAFVAMAGEDAARKEEPRKVPSVLPAEQVDEAAWDAWRAELRRLRDADEGYKAAVAALDAYDGDDEVEFAELRSFRDDLFREIARSVFERFFGTWMGSDEEFDDLIGPFQTVNQNTVKACLEGAVTLCGQGKVCSVSVTDEHCNVVCQDGSGGCPPVQGP